MFKRFLRLAALGMLAAAVMSAPLFGAGAEAAVSSIEEAREPALAPGELREVALGDAPAEISFVAPTGSVYDVWLFPAGDMPVEAHVQLWQGGALVAEGEGSMPALSLRLTAGATYALRLTGKGTARLEIARHALSRCFDMPMRLDARGDERAKLFARQGDAHWYALECEAPASLAILGVPSEPGMALEAAAFDEAGHLVASALTTAGGAALARLEAGAGKYRLRLTARGGATGLYTLRVTPLTQEEPAAIDLSRRVARLAGRSSVRLEAGAAEFVHWESSDPSVAAVDESGRVTGRGEGRAIVTAYTPGGASAGCLVAVQYVPVAAVNLLSRRISLCVGDDAAIECEVLPDSATDPRLEYAAEPEGIVEIDRRGVLRGVGEGACTVTVRTVDGGWKDALSVTVGPAPKRWRALLVGEQNYASTVAPVRTGSVNSVMGLRSMLSGLSFSGARFQTTTLLDASRDGVLAGIRDAFAGAAAGDVSLFYITCHGYYARGMTCFEMYDGSVLTAAELVRALMDVPGEVFLVIDCCGSGGVIGRASDTGDILKGVDAVFGGDVRPAAVDGSRFRVLASAALEQDSHRISFTGGAGETDMATVFARALCEGGGWNLERAAKSAMRADLDYDGRVTLNELHAYVSRRVMWYLNLAGPQGQYAQSVQVWPEGLDEAVFERTK